MDDVQRGDWITAKAADGKARELRALDGTVAGGDFAVVWACSPAEWEAAESEGREPEGIPWPAEDVEAVDREPVTA
jgi:hypothetical protein